jgi:hypothetical protein
MRDLNDEKDYSWNNVNSDPSIMDIEYEKAYGDLQDYYTSAQTEERISEAFSEATTSGITRQELQETISNETARTENTYLKEHQSLADYYTSAQTDSAITSVLSEYYNSGQTNEKIAEAISGITFSGISQTELDTAIANETARTEQTYLKEHQSLEEYYTSAQTETAIQNAVSGIDLGDFYTSAQTDAAIQNAVSGIDLSDYYTSAQTNNAITEVISNETARTESAYSKTEHTHSEYVTSGDVKTQIDTAISSETARTESAYSKTGHTHSEYVTSGDVQNQITSGLNAYYTSAETDTAIQNAVSGIDLSDYYTSAQTDTAIQNAVSGIDLGDYYTSAQTESAITSAITDVMSVIEDNEEVTAFAFNVVNRRFSDYYTSAQTENTYSKTGHTHSEYVTSGDVQTQINTALSGETARTENAYSKTGHTHSEYVTSGDVQNQISSGLTDYYTSAQTESAITDVMSVIESNERVTAFAFNDVNDRFTDYYTSAQTDTAIQNAVSGINLGDYYTSAQTESTIANAIADETARTESVYLKEHQSLSGVGASIVYNSDVTKVQLKNSGGQVISEFDASLFIKDGMLSSVTIDNVEISGTSAPCLVMVFNTDAGTSNINVPLSLIFKPDNYYTSAQTNNAITSAITDVMSVIEDNEEVTAFAFNDVNKRFSDYYTSAQTESTYAKTGHTHSEYVTSGDVQTQISTALSGETARTENTYSKTGHTHSEYVTSGDVQSQISSAVTEVSQHCLPQVTSSDNGKTLQIVNGVWTLVDPTTIYSGSGTPNNQEGNNGDIYMQTE